MQLKGDQALSPFNLTTDASEKIPGTAVSKLNRPLLDKCYFVHMEFLW